MARAPGSRPGPSSARYGVVGHPVEHSLSPQIHGAFARQAGVAIDYMRILSPLDRFAETVDAFFANQGRGLNVTVPFKVEARAACERLSERATRAGAVNWLKLEQGGMVGDNTDGAGLVRDLDRLLAGSGHGLAGTRILLLGAGGAARGVVGPLVDREPAAMVVANRTVSRAAALVASASASRLQARSFEAVGEEPFDVIVNATSASLSNESIPLPRSTLAQAGLVYDMMYGAEPTPFLVAAQRAGCGSTADGLGMLVEQAAESFFLWHGVRPETASVLRSLRESIATSKR